MSLWRSECVSNYDDHIRNWIVLKLTEEEIEWASAAVLKPIALSAPELLDKFRFEDETSNYSLPVPERWVAI